MSYIISNGKSYGGSINLVTQGIDFIEIKYKDYLKIEDRETNGVLYSITDLEQYIAAKNVEYDNSNSKLTSDNVQDAIDELLENGIGGGGGDASIDDTTVSTETTWSSNKVNENITNSLSDAKSYTNTEISKLLNGAPETMDTLKEVADAMAEHAEVTDALNAAIGNKVSKEEGKGLFSGSYKDLTDAPTLVEGDNITITTDKDTNEITISSDNSSNLIADTATGSNPTINNSTDGNVVYLKDSGYTEQYSTDGNNLLAYNNVYRSFTAGQTFTQFSIVGNPFSKGAGKYNYSCSGDFGDAYNYGLWVYDKDNNLLLNITNIGAIGRAIEITEDVANNTVRVDVVVGGLVVGTTYSGYIYPQISYGETKLDYEPYTNGASPNPDYPQEINGLGDKGYFDGELLQGYRSTTTSTPNGNANYITNKNAIECKEGDTLEIMYEVGARLVFQFFNDGTWVEQIGVSSGEKVTEYSCTVPSGANQAYFFIQYANITPSTAKHICVTINGQYALRVKSVNKNILDVSAENERNIKTQNPDHTVEYEKGVVKYTVNSLPQAYSQAGYFYDFDTVIGKKYSVNAIFSGDCIVNVRVYKARENVDANMITKLTSGETFTFVADTEECMLRVWIQPTIGMGTIKAIITEGEYDGVYEPHQSSEALIPVSAPFYKGDYIEVYADGSGREYHKMESVVYDGSEEWYPASNDLNSENVKTIYYTTNNSVKKNNPILFCDRYKKSNNHYSEINNFEMQGYNHSDTTYPKQNWLYFKNNNCSTVDEWKKELSNNPIHVVYELATPISTPLTAEQVAEFMKLQTFKGVTHASADGEVTVKYYCNNDNGKVCAMLQKQINTIKCNFNLSTNAVVDFGSIDG